MTTQKLLNLLCLAGTVLCSGCASVRVKTDLLPETNPTLSSASGAFYIAGLSYSCDDGQVRTTPLAVDVAYEKNLLRLLRKECPARYPLLFSEDAESAVSLFVTVEEEYKMNQFKIVAWMLGTLTIVPMILPAPFIDIERNISVSVGAWNGTDSKGSQTVRSAFHRKQIGWGTMLTPLALIPVPGESDFPKESSVFDMSRQAYDDIPQVAQQVATAIAKMAAEKDPSFWISVSRGNGSPFFPSSYPAAPAALPLPDETIAPF